MSMAIMQEHPNIAISEMILGENKSTANLLQIIDAMMLNFDVYAYDKGKVVLSALYLILRADI